MNILRKPKADAAERELAELRRQKDEIERQSRKVKAARKGPPKAPRKKKREPVATLPPPDDLADLRRERRFYAELKTRGQVHNEIRAEAGSVFLLVLLIAAIIAIILWTVRGLHVY